MHADHTAASLSARGLDSEAPAASPDLGAGLRAARQTNVSSWTTSRQRTDSSPGVLIDADVPTPTPAPEAELLADEAAAAAGREEPDLSEARPVKPMRVDKIEKKANSARPGQLPQRFLQLRGDAEQAARVRGSANRTDNRRTTNRAR